MYADPDDIVTYAEFGLDQLKGFVFFGGVKVWCFVQERDAAHR